VWLRIWAFWSDAVSLGDWFLTFQRLMVPLSSCIKQSKKIFWDIRNHWPSDTASYLGKLESSKTLCLKLGAYEVC
jgi:hypothetical protein